VDDLGGGDQRALLPVHELGERVGLQVAPDVHALLLVEGVPEIGPVDGDGPVRHAHRVVGVDLLGPVEPLRRVPLLLLALGIEPEQVVAAVLVLPGERGGGLAVDLPLGLLDGQAVEVGARHVLLLRWVRALTKRLGCREG
jgi:hypothetical protein